MSKKELRAPDEFQSFILELTEKYGNYWKLAVVVLILVIVIPIGISGYNYFNNKKENNAAEKFSVLTNNIQTLNYDKKISEINKFLNNFGGSKAAFEALLLKGKILFENKKYQDAITVFNKILYNAPSEEFKLQAKLDIALSKLQSGDTSAAVKLLSELTDNNITGADASFYLAVYYEKNNELLKAKSFYQEIVDKYKNYPYFQVAKLKIEIL